MSAPVTVVVPIHSTDEENLADVRACLDSVVRHGPATSTVFDVLVIDDASPYGDVAAVVDALQAGPPMAFRRHEENRGFVATANEGFASAAGDVVLLNSDTVVTAGWLDRMVAAAEHESVATVTPLTNSGSICTLPEDIRRAFDLDDDVPRIDECAAFVADHSLGLCPAVISGVGFCLLVTRAALDQCGPFDEATFGRGYGEEVDFSLRAGALGFRHLVEDATFVYHRGAGSFGAAREASMAQASTILRQRHPGFKQRNRQERANDPLAPVFFALRDALAPRQRGRPHVLHVLHEPSRFGGTEMHLKRLIDTLRDDIDASTVHPSPEGTVLRSEWRSPDGTDHVATRLLSPDPVDEGDDGLPATGGHDREQSNIQLIRDLFDLTAVHIHNLIGHPLETIVDLADFDGPVVCSIHDLYLACPNHSLLYRDASPCGIPEDLDVCATCLPETRGRSRTDLERHRATVAAGLDSVDHWVVFSQAAADHLLRAYPIDPDRLRLLPHGTVIAADPPPLDGAHLLHDPLQVAFVGRGWAKKGLDLVNRAADQIAGNPDVGVHHFGELRDDLSHHITGHGPYDNRELPALLQAAGIGVVLIPGPYAETYGFVMSESLQAGIPVIGPYYGAIGERIRATEAGWTIDPEDDASLPTLLTDLARCRFEVLRASRRARSVHLDNVAVSAPRYLDLYRTTTVPTAQPTEPTEREDGTPA